MYVRASFSNDYTKLDKYCLVVFVIIRTRKLFYLHVMLFIFYFDTNPGYVQMELGLEAESEFKARQIVEKSSWMRTKGGTGIAIENGLGTKRVWRWDQN
ncbi:hypothetical protein EVAR_93027_1 [Eumeta japonica]|uniref:Uncharacterized protein n=1 Tax=Eumeta variegata TaxID=151549 RepID=A0A4C2ADR0_EUMVA|nr:hypothetical protein EVAR_93027_1 [Eumeta japonica]